METICSLNEFSQILLRAKQLRTVIYSSYGSPENSNFETRQNLGENSSARTLLVLISKQLLQLDQNWTELNSLQILELNFLKMCFEQVRCYLGRGSIVLLHSAIDMFVNVLELGLRKVWADFVNWKRFFYLNLHFEKIKRKFFWIDILIDFCCASFSENVCLWVNIFSMTSFVIFYYFSEWGCLYLISGFSIKCWKFFSLEMNFSFFLELYEKIQYIEQEVN